MAEMGDQIAEEMAYSALDERKDGGEEGRYDPMLGDGGDSADPFSQLAEVLALGMKEQTDEEDEERI
jgi:hypothetical protein